MNNLIDFPIPANDDASKSISVIIKAMCDAIQEGLNEKALDNDKVEEEEILEEDSFTKTEEEEKTERSGRRRRMGEVGGDDTMEEKKKRPASRRPISKK